MLKTTRHLLQFGFLALTLTGVFILGANAERWCPFGGVEALYTYLNEGNLVCSLAVSNFYILAAVLLSALILRRVFCGYVCPIGAISEWIQVLASRLGLKPARIGRRLDLFLSLLKYPALAAILYFTWKTSELIFRGFDPCYALLSRHGEDITFWTYFTAGAVIVVSLFIKVPFCRWLCPLAAVLNPFSRFGLLRIQRNADACTGCKKCARACPMAIAVDEVAEVTKARCTSCLDCIEACPERENRALVWGPWKRAGSLAKTAAGWSQAALIGILILLMTVAVSAAYLFPLPSFMWSRGQASEEIAVVSLQLENLGCRGNASLLTYFLDRDDELEIPGYIKLEAWPGPGTAETRILFDPARTDETLIKMAITEAYYDSDAHIWRASPFLIQGYDPLGL